MQRDNKLTLKKLALSKIHIEGGAPEDIRAALIRLGMKDLRGQDDRLWNVSKEPYLFIFSERDFITSGDRYVYEVSDFREMTAQELYSILFQKDESSGSDESWTFEGGKREAPFYMVYVEGRDCPTKKHKTFEAAEAEAERLSKVMNRNAYVLSACMEVKTEQVVRKTYIEDMNQIDE